MKRIFYIFVVCLFIGMFFWNCGEKEPVPMDYPIKPVPLIQVDITDDFWAPKQEVNRTVSIQHCFSRQEERGRGGSSNLFEAAGYMIAKKADPAFEAYIKAKVDALVERHAAAAQSQARRPRGVSAEFAVSWFNATGDRRLLDIAIKNADELYEAYGPDKESGAEVGGGGGGGGLVRLYQFTGDEKYLELSQFFLDRKGRNIDPQALHPAYPGDLEYRQNHKPVIEQREAIGHAVAAASLYTWLTDIARLTGQPEYAQAADKIWESIVSKKMYITGGIGAIRQQEKFGAAYELPNVNSWHETCASRGNVVYNQRLFLLHGDAKYIDTMERVLYNGLLAGVSLKGNRFTYQNILMSYGNYERFDWINVAGCPPNLVRLIAQLGSYIYAQNEKEIYVNLYVGSKADVKLGETNVKIAQETSYPWEGKVKITVDPEKPGKFAVYVRIPGWAQNRPVPSDLYTYVDPTSEQPTLSVNGKAVELELEKGYVRLQREWKAGDVIDLNLPMPVHKAVAHENVLDDRGRLALERGPLVYCVEWPDNGGSALNIFVPEEASLKGEFRPDLLNGIGVITGEVGAITRGEDGVSIKTAPHSLVAIPYYAWANRGMGEMTTWIARDAATARLEPALPDPIAKVSYFGGIWEAWTGPEGYADHNDDICAVYDGVEPMHSFDESHLYFRMRPPQGKPAWIQYDFKAPVEVASTQVYFVDDQRFCQLPESWRILYKDGSAWKPVENNEPYTVDKDKFNTVSFKPVKTTAIRIEVEPQKILYRKGAAGPPGALTIREDMIWREFGIIEWRVK